MRSQQRPIIPLRLGPLTRKSRRGQQRSLVDFALRAAATVICIGTALPLTHAKAGWIRIFDFPRAQLFGAGVAVLAATLLRGTSNGGNSKLLAAVSAALIAQFVQIRPYTRLARRQVIHKDARSGVAVKIFTANVRMRNKSVGRVRDAIARTDPDIALLLEPDRWWLEQLGLAKVYPYRLEYPLSNTYGILLYSKFPLLDAEVRFLVQNDIPSIRTGIGLPDGSTARLYAVHPRPPARWGPDTKLSLRGSAKRDAELIVIAKGIRNCSDPVIVAGDFNDVAWSHTTRRFQRISRLLDPRVGRGFYNTFHAQYRMLRFPLDHLFHSEHFAVAEFSRLPSIGSDHFPIAATLVLDPRAPVEQNTPDVKADDFKEAAKDVQAAQTNELKVAIRPGSSSSDIRSSALTGP